MLFLVNLPAQSWFIYQSAIPFVLKWNGAVVRWLTSRVRHADFRNTPLRKRLTSWVSLLTVLDVPSRGVGLYEVDHGRGIFQSMRMMVAIRFVENSDRAAQRLIPLFENG